MFVQVQALGHVGKDPELTVTANGITVCKFSLASTRKGRNGQPDKTTWLNITAWRGLGETIEKYVTSGQLLFIQGELDHRSYETRDGRLGCSLDVTLDKFSFAGGGRMSDDDENDDAFLPDYPDELDSPLPATNGSMQAARSQEYQRAAVAASHKNGNGNGNKTASARKK